MAELVSSMTSRKLGELDASHVVEARGGFEEEAGGATDIEKSPSRLDSGKHGRHSSRPLQTLLTLSQIITKDVSRKVIRTVDSRQFSLSEGPVDVDQLAARTLGYRIPVLREKPLTPCLSAQQAPLPRGDHSEAG
jgi:hypothetical protein